MNNLRAPRLKSFDTYKLFTVFWPPYNSWDMHTWAHSTGQPLTPITAICGVHTNTRGRKDEFSIC